MISIRYETLTQAVPKRIGEGPWWKDLVDYGLTPNEPPGSAVEL